MLEQILSILKENQIKKYTIAQNKIEAAELYLIKDKVNMHRTKEKELYSLTVYNDFTQDNVEYTGSANVELYPSMDKEELTAAIKDAYFATQFVKNKRYDIADGEKAELALASTEKSLQDIMFEVKDALYTNDRIGNGLVNSAEIFVTKNNARKVTSKGADVKYTSYKISGEFISQWKEQNDVELYNSFSYDNLDAADLALKVKEAIEDAGYRDKAIEPVKTGKYNVVIKDSSVIEFLSYYVAASNAGQIYRKLSSAAIEDKIQGENVTGDKLNVTVTSSVPFNAEGIRLVDRTLIEDGVLKLITGPTQYMQYLGLEPIGGYNELKVQGGSVTYDDILEEGDLFILRFSDFQSDPVTGDFGGEIRLALLKQNGKLVPFTGGSLNAKEVQESMILSKELQKDGANVVPKAIKFKDIQISGK